MSLSASGSTRPYVVSAEQHRDSENRVESGTARASRRERGERHGGGSSARRMSISSTATPAGGHRVLHDRYYDEKSVEGIQVSDQVERRRRPAQPEAHCHIPGPSPVEASAGRHCASTSAATARAPQLASASRGSAPACSTTSVSGSRTMRPGRRRGVVPDRPHLLLADASTGPAPPGEGGGGRTALGLRHLVTRPVVFGVDESKKSVLHPTGDRRSPTSSAAAGGGQTEEAQAWQTRRPSTATWPR